MRQAELIFFKTLRMDDGEESQIDCPTETAQNRLFSLLKSIQKDYAKKFGSKDPDVDRITITKHKTQAGKFLITILKEERLFSSVVIKKKDGTEESIKPEDLKSD